MGQQQLENHKEVEELAGGRKEFHLNFFVCFVLPVTRVGFKDR
jgi:hypothetical protein